MRTRKHRKSGAWPCCATGRRPGTEAGRMQGRSDHPLSPDAGLAKVSRLAASRKRLRRLGRGTAARYSRAAMTAAAMGHPEAQVEERLIEMDWGEWEGARLTGAPRPPWVPRWRRWRTEGLDFQASRAAKARAMSKDRLKPLPPDTLPAAPVNRPSPWPTKASFGQLYAAASGWPLLGPRARKNCGSPATTSLHLDDTGGASPGSRG